jgi:hypothetical protein
LYPHKGKVAAQANSSFFVYLIKGHPTNGFSDLIDFLRELEKNLPLKKAIG